MRYNLVEVLKGLSREDLQILMVNVQLEMLNRSTLKNGECHLKLVWTHPTMKRVVKRRV